MRSFYKKLPGSRMIFLPNTSDATCLTNWKYVVTSSVFAGSREGLFVVREGEVLYETACQFTKDRFQHCFDCELTQFYPIILTSWLKGELQAVVGVRSAVDGPLFLEQYLDSPVEVLFEELSLDRSQIVEIGGFAALDKMAAIPLMEKTANVLLEMGFAHAVCTANKPIRRCLSSINVPFEQLAVADSKLLQGSTESWGSYYATTPFVLAGDIQTGADAIDALFQLAA
jgi:hypothetical protein